MKKSTNTAKIIGIIASLAVIVSLWQAVCLLTGLGDFILPSPLSVAAALVRDQSLILKHLGFTLAVTLIGWGLSVIFALALGALLDRLPPLERFLQPYLVLSQTIPTVFLYPLLLIWMGFGPAPRLLVVFLACFFPILVAFLQGLKSSQAAHADLFYSLGATRGQVFWGVKFPSALPALFAGLKIAAAYSVMASVVGEWLGAKEGIGVYMLRSYKAFQTPQVFGAIVLVSGLSFFFYYLISLWEKYATRWRNRSSYEST